MNWVWTYYFGVNLKKKEFNIALGWAQNSVHEFNIYLLLYFEHIFYIFVLFCLKFQYFFQFQEATSTKNSKHKFIDIKQKRPIIFANSMYFYGNYVRFYFSLKNCWRMYRDFIVYLNFLIIFNLFDELGNAKFGL